MFWAPLMALLAAMASDSADETPRPEYGSPQEKTIFELIYEGDTGNVTRMLVRKLAVMIETGQVRTYQDAARVLATMGLGDPNTREFCQLGNLLYCLAMAEKRRSIWVLDEEACLALMNTNPPWELARGKLPRLPYPAMLIRLPTTIAVVTKDIPYPVEVSSILLIEEVPERRWRYLGMNNAKTMEKMIYNHGWFDVSGASAKAQLVEGQGIPDDGDYRLTGEDVVWSFLINLLLALQHKHLEGRVIQPRTEKKSPKKLKKLGSMDAYTVVRLSRDTRAAREKQQEEADRAEASRAPQARHLRRGHWKGQWVLDPGDKPVFATKARISRSGEPIEGYLYQTAVWIFPYWAGHGQSREVGKYRVKR